jgi:hypothetical protein
MVDKVELVKPKGVEDEIHLDKDAAKGKNATWGKRGK